VRFGSPAVTTRGFREAEMREVASLVARVIEHAEDEGVLAEVRRKVDALTAAYPLYGWKLTAAACR
jgi:glycine hydroxymethyltransferase